MIRAISLTMGLWVCLTLSCPTPAVAEPKPSEVEPTLAELLDSLKKAEADFASGNYEQAQAQLKDINDSRLATADKIRLYLLNARLESLYDRPHNARTWLEKLYELGPNNRLDPIKDPPALLDLWAEVAAEGAKKQAEAKGERGQPGSSETTDAQASSPEDGAKLKPSVLSRVLPFGIGHFDSGAYAPGAFFLGSEIVLLALPELIDKEVVVADGYGATAQQLQNAKIASIVGVIGLWGYEVNNLLPLISEINQDAAQMTRQIMGALPFGVGQASRGHYRKAIGFGVVETTFLLIGVFNQESAVRNSAMNLFYGTALVGAVDALFSKPEVPGAEPGSSSKTVSFNILPRFRDDQVQWLLTGRYSF